MSAEADRNGDHPPAHVVVAGVEKPMGSLVALLVLIAEQLVGAHSAWTSVPRRMG